MRSNPTLLPVPIRRRTSLVVAAAGVVALSLLGFPFSPQAIYVAPGDRPATAAQPERHKQAAPDSAARPVSAALRPMLTGQAESTTERAAVDRPGDAGLAENSWDFNAPDSVPGFGPLDPAEARRLAKMLFER
jgi:hypothetical protein